MQQAQIRDSNKLISAWGEPQALCLALYKSLIKFSFSAIVDYYYHKSLQTVLGIFMAGFVRNLYIFFTKPV